MLLCLIHRQYFPCLGCVSNWENTQRALDDFCFNLEKKTAVSLSLSFWRYHHFSSVENFFGNSAGPLAHTLSLSLALFVISPVVTPSKRNNQCTTRCASPPWSMPNALRRAFRFWTFRCQTTQSWWKGSAAAENCVVPPKVQKRCVGPGGLGSGWQGDDHIGEHFRLEKFEQRSARFRSPQNARPCQWVWMNKQVDQRPS